MHALDKGQSNSFFLVQKYFFCETLSLAILK